MTKPALDSFFVGRAIAEGLYEQLEHTLTNAFSELGKFDAEQKERLRQFTERVIERAHQEAEQVTGEPLISTGNGSEIQGLDLQATLDELRAEVAQLRSELQLYRNRTV